MKAKRINEAILDQKITQVIKQNTIQLEKPCKRLLCLMYRKISDTVIQELYMELSSRIGSEDLIERVFINGISDVKRGVETALGHFRKRTERGILRINSNSYYVPIVFMADQLKADIMKQILDIFREVMLRAGFGDFQIVYYCIFHYGTMNGKPCWKELDEIHKLSSEYAFPVCIVTHDNNYFSEDWGYSKAIQSMAMHMFLQLPLNADEADRKAFQGVGKKFIIGYWKMDLLKQQIINYLEKCARRQNEPIFDDVTYLNLIQKAVENIITLDEKYWLETMCHMPVNYTEIEKEMHPAIYSGGKFIKYKDIFEKMYGRADILAFFLKKIIGIGNEEKYIEAFFEEDIGNLHAVKSMLAVALKNLRKQYVSDKETWDKQKKNLEDSYRFKRGCTLEEIIQNLRACYWEDEIKLVAVERKISFLEKLEEYIRTEDFLQKLSEIEGQNQKGRMQLRRIWQRDMLTEQKQGEERVPGVTYDSRNLKWNENVFELKFITDRLECIENLKEQMREWLKKNFSNVLGDFILYLEDLKRYHYKDIYYTARLNSPSDSLELEFLYISSIFLDKDIGNIRASLPRVQVVAREWLPETCFEFFSMKEIKDLTEIYSVDSMR